MVYNIGSVSRLLIILKPILILEYSRNITELISKTTYFLRKVGSQQLFYFSAEQESVLV